MEQWLYNETLSIMHLMMIFYPFTFPLSFNPSISCKVNLNLETNCLPIIDI
jgi:hypothetical protein